MKLDGAVKYLTAIAQPRDPKPKEDSVSEESDVEGAPNVEEESNGEGASNVEEESNAEDTSSSEEVASRSSDNEELPWALNTNVLPFFLLMFPVLQLLATETNRYSLQNHIDKPNEPPMHTDVFELVNFLACVISMGLVELPALRMYWETSDSLFFQPFVANIMSRDRFKELLKYLHAADNSKAAPRGHQNYDKIYKVRVFLAKLQEAWRRNYNIGKEVGC